MPQCAVVGCNSTHRRTKGGSIKYHRFPGDSVTRHQWLEACGKTLNNCSTARICSRHFSLSSYERDVQHELLGLPTRCRLKRGAVPDKNLPSDFLNEEDQPESAIAILLAVGLVPNNQPNRGGLPEYLNKMQIMEEVREGCYANPPSSPGHAEECRNEDDDGTHDNLKTKDINEDAAREIDEKDKVLISVTIKEEKEEEQTYKEQELKHEENSCSSSSNSETSNKRKLEKEESPTKRMKFDIRDSFATRNKILNEFMEFAECNSIEEIHTFSEQILIEIQTLNKLAKEKEREWNQIIHMKKIKEELLLRLQRKRQVLLINDSDLSDLYPEINGQSSLLRCNQKSNMLRDVSMETRNQKYLLPKSRLDLSSLDLRQKQKSLVDVQSIIADYRQRHPEAVPRRGRRIRHSQADNQSNIFGFSGGNFSTGQKSGIDTNGDSKLLSTTMNGSQDISQTSSVDSSYQDRTSYKDILVQFAKLSQNERRELQMQFNDATKPPPPYREVTLPPVTSSIPVEPTNSLLHGILTKSPVQSSNSINTNNSSINDGSKTSFSPTLARLLTVPEKATSNIIASVPDVTCGNQMDSTNMSISDIVCDSKIGDNSEEHLDRLEIDEASKNTSRSKDDNDLDNAEDIPQCQGCNLKVAQFVCAGCGSQWYCSRDCQVTAWDDHSEVCSG